MTFESFAPKEDEVEKVLDIIKSKYEVKEDRIEIGKQYSVKYITIDEKSIYMTGPLANKSYLRSKLFNDLADEVDLYSEASINKAIKIFIDQQSK
jgi:hypothetical protein